MAQKKVIATEEEKDSVALLRGVAVTYDVAGTIMRLVSDYGQYEVGVRVNLKDRYIPTAEVGLGSANHETDAVTGIRAKTNAPYLRLGCDYNMMKNKHDDYRVLLGVRYGITSFKQEIEGDVTDKYWGGTAAYSVDMPRCTYGWAELLFGVDAKISGPVRLGWTFRYRRKLHSSDIGNNQLWYVPGYGKAGNTLGGTFFVSIQLGH